jgi:hypothetical protein
MLKIVFGGEVTQSDNLVTKMSLDKVNPDLENAMLSFTHLFKPTL